MSVEGQTTGENLVFVQLTLLLAAAKKHSYCSQEQPEQVHSTEVLINSTHFLLGGHNTFSNLIRSPKHD